MKKFFIAALLIASVATSSFATDLNNVNSSVQNSFKHEYANASNVTWKVSNDFAKASFTENGEKVDAFYTHTGELIGVSRNISLDAIPVSAKRAFAKKYADYTVKEAIKFDGLEENAYFISAENEKASVILKVTSGGTSLFKKSCKK